MGGNALKNCNIRRYDAVEYYELEKEVVTKLRAYFGNVRIAPILSYGNKETFGDMDILLESPVPHGDLREVFRTLFQSKEVVSEGYVHGHRLPSGQFWLKKTVSPPADAVLEFNETGCISFEYKEFQIDVLCTPTRYFDFCLNYYNFNDLGNLCGVLAKSLGATLGFDGLWLKVRENTRQFGKILLTSDFDTALSFLEFDVTRYRQGFKTPEEMFAFVTANPYFHADWYLLANRNNKSRARDAKRVTYRNFLKYIEEHPTSSQAFFLTKESARQRLYAQFPGVEEAVVKMKRQALQKSTERKIFSGQVVGDATGLSGLELGKVMEHIRVKFSTPEAFSEFTLSVSMAEMQILAKTAKAELGF